MSEYREIVEREPEYVLDRHAVVATGMEALARVKSRGGATIIQTGKCKRLHFDAVRICIGAVALVAVGVGAGRAFGVDAAFLAVGLVLAALTWSR